MGRLLVALDPDVGVIPQDLVRDWGLDEEAAGIGSASLEQPRGGTFFPGLLELVVVPLAVNLASNAITGLVKRLVERRCAPGSESTELEIVESTTGQDRVVVVRKRRVIS